MHCVKLMVGVEILISQYHGVYSPQMWKDDFPSLRSTTFNAFSDKTSPQFGSLTGITVAEVSFIKVFTTYKNTFIVVPFTIYTRTFYINSTKKLWPLNTKIPWIAVLHTYLPQVAVLQTVYQEQLWKDSRCTQKSVTHRSLCHDEEVLYRLCQVHWSSQNCDPTKLMQATVKNVKTI